MGQALWLAVHLPALPIEVLGRGLPGNDAPLAVLEDDRVLLACPQALEAGIRTGLSRATALAVLPSLQALPRQATRETDALSQLAAWAQRYTPVLHPCPPSGLMLEIGASLRLFGGLDRLLHSLRQGFRELGFHACTAVACTPGAAWMFARHEDGAVVPVSELASRLSRLPLHLLDTALPHLDRLHGAGLHRCGELTVLPTAELARRFGPALVQELERAHGTRPDPRPIFQAAPVFEACLELPVPVPALEQVAFAAHRLLLQLAGWLEARRRAARAFGLALWFEDHPALQVEARLASPSADAARFVQLLHERLARLQLPAAVERISLHCDQLADAPPGSLSFLPDPNAQETGLAQLLERLQARLGDRRVQRLFTVADHRPEFAFSLTHVERLPGSPSTHDTRGEASSTAPGLPRPLWLLRTPEPLAERQQRPWLHGPLQLLAGPERIEGGWWDLRPVQRDYFVAQDQDTVLYWIFRSRDTRQTRGGWFLHGRFG